MEVVPDRSAASLCGFVEAAVEPGVVVVTAAWGGHPLPDRGYRHLPVAAQGDPRVAEDFLPISHLIFSNLESWREAAITASAGSIFCKPISMSSRSGLIGAFIRSTPSGHCSGSAGRRLLQPMTGSTPAYNERHVGF